MIGLVKHLSRVVLLIILMQVIFMYPALALTKTEYIRLGIDHYDEVGLACTSSVSGNEGLSYEENHKYAWDYLVNKKSLSPNAAAGLMGNLEAESGINPQNLQNSAPAPLGDGPTMPTIVDPNNKVVPDPRIAGKYGYGIAQWTTVSRQQGLIDRAIQQNKSNGAIDVQFDHLWAELESQWFSDVLAVLQDPNTTIEEASDKVLIDFEAPASTIYMPDKGESYQDHLTSLENAKIARRAQSQKMLSQYSGSTFSSGNNCSDSSRGDVLGGSGIVDAETGYSFPMAPQQRSRVGGITINQTVSTHADGPAFDLFGPGQEGNKGGDDVYAFDDGVVYAVGEEDPGWCYSIQLQADDGYYYWYGHLNNVTVKRGDRVKAGQVMGETAQWTPDHNCAGTSGATHLHIDRGCTIIENGVEVHQTGGRPECRDPDFIPLLSQIYGRLP